MDGGASNPYLLMVACVAAGMEGLRNHLELLAPVARIAYGLEGVVDLPTALDEVVEALEPDAALQAVLGPELVRLAVAIKRYELNKAKAALSDSGTPEFSQRVDDGEHHESFEFL